MNRRNWMIAAAAALAIITAITIPYGWRLVRGILVNRGIDAVKLRLPKAVWSVETVESGEPSGCWHQISEEMSVLIVCGSDGPSESSSVGRAGGPMRLAIEPGSEIEWTWATLGRTKVSESVRQAAKRLQPKLHLAQSTEEVVRAIADDPALADGDTLAEFIVLTFAGAVATGKCEPLSAWASGGLSKQEGIVHSVLLLSKLAARPVKLQEQPECNLMIGEESPNGHMAIYAWSKDGVLTETLLLKRQGNDTAAVAEVRIKMSTGQQ